MVARSGRKVSDPFIEPYNRPARRKGSGEGLCEKQLELAELRTDVASDNRHGMSERQGLLARWDGPKHPYEP
jgi:hypothetical protein